MWYDQGMLGIGNMKRIFPSVMKNEKCLQASGKIGTGVWTIDCIVSFMMNKRWQGNISPSLGFLKCRVEDGTSAFIRSITYN